MLKSIVIEEELYLFLIKECPNSITRIAKEAIENSVQILFWKDEMIQAFLTYANINEISKYSEKIHVESNSENRENAISLESNSKNSQNTISSESNSKNSQNITEKDRDDYKKEEYAFNNGNFGYKNYIFIINKESNKQGLKNLNISIIAYYDSRLNSDYMMGVDMVLEGLNDIDYTFIENVYKRHYKIPITIAETNRLIIREITIDDLDQLYQIYSNDEITEYMEGLYENRAEEEEFTKAYIENMYGFYGYGLWVLIEKETGKLIGRAGLSNREINDEISVEIGYVIGKEYQRRGYAYEACKKIIEYAKDWLEIPGLNCFIQKGNEASVKLAQKLGFEKIDEVSIDEKLHEWYRIIL